jgi:hypothetical protein
MVFIGLKKDEGAVVTILLVIEHTVYYCTLVLGLQIKRLVITKWFSIWSMNVRWSSFKCLVYYYPTGLWF